jgi:hypothetical protein
MIGGKRTRKNVVGEKDSILEKKSLSSHGYF